MKNASSYNLVHITTSGEYKTPLVASQLFDQAEFQAANKEGFAPGKVEAWIMGAMREYFDNDAKAKIKSIKARCPHIGIRMINGISRLGNFPAMQLAHHYRRKLGIRTPVIYHCRGEGAAAWAVELRKSFPQDKVVLDVRGYWPAEILYARGIEDPATATGADRETFLKANESLRSIIRKVDAVTTVSDALRDLLITEMGAQQHTVVVPCCVNSVTADDRREELRKSWGLKDNEIAVVYSGSTAAYQHLQDLTIPFLKELAAQNANVRLVFFSAESEKIKNILIAAGVATDKVILKNFPQREVAAALTACDAGILIRKPTIVNRVANPVKIAEYLASGLPIIIEKGVGGVQDVAFQRSVMKGIEIAAPGADMAEAASEVNTWLADGLEQKRQWAREYVSDVYLWSAAIQVSRGMYKEALNNN